MLTNLFTPKAVAVVGASQSPDKVGHSILKNIIDLGFEGQVYPVNPKSTEILGKKCYPDISALPDGVDLVVISIPAKFVPQVIEECGKKHIGSAVVISAGFKEVGREGKDLERRLENAAIMSGVRVLGPNCVGFINTSNKLNASFAADCPEPGDIAVISQSGAMCTSIIDWSLKHHIGFSKLISIGNKADLDEEILIESLGEDKDTNVIVGYLEDIKNGPHFIRTAEKVTRNKPIILIKAGTTAAGASAASSHTGSIAGAQMAYECAFHSSGVMQAPSLEALFDYAQVFAYQPLPKSDRVAIVTNAGGLGIMATDAIENAGLQFAKPSEATVEKLKSFLSPAANVHNPFDILGDARAETYGKAVETALADDGIDSLVVLLSPQTMTEAGNAASEIVKAAKKFNKPVVASFVGARRVAEGIEVLQKNRIPHYATPERAVGAINVLVDYTKWRSAPRKVIKRFSVNSTKVDRVINLNKKRKFTNIGEQDSKSILSAYGFTVPVCHLSRSVDDAVSAASAIGYPVVMKIVSPDIVHKSDAGGVKVGLKGPSEVADAFELMMTRIKARCPDARLHGVLVQEMVMEGREIIIGMTRDPQFGPMLMFGLGGIYVEVLKDVSFQLAPITAEAALQMIVGTKTYNLLKGVRGEKSADMHLVAECIQRISQLSMDFPTIQELDINPLKVSSELSRAVAVDARVRIL
ncbi:MAG: CoA-binding protein [Deltaproteobacteria bacterium]|jgi:acetate---CoA ligase (ADP-forming)|nr:CoA-binding protein [Deltaproteobacteria bacterium]